MQFSEKKWLPRTFSNFLLKNIFGGCRCAPALLSRMLYSKGLVINNGGWGGRTTKIGGGGGGGKSFSHAEGGHKKFPSFNGDTWRNVTMHGKLVEIMWPIIKLSKVQGNLNIYQNC